MPKHAPGRPSRERILRFIETSDTPAGKREIARAFGLHGNDKIALKALLKDMADEGLIDSAPGRAFHKMGGVPKVTVLRVVDVDDSGRAWAVPERWEADGPPPRLRVVSEAATVRARRRRPHPRADRGSREGLDRPPDEANCQRGELVLGVVHQEEGGQPVARPVDKRERRDWPVSDAGPGAAGDLVLAEKTGRPPRISVRVTERLGDPFAPRSFSLIAIHKLRHPRLLRRGARRGGAGGAAAARRARGPAPPADRRDRSGRRARP